MAFPEMNETPTDLRSMDHGLTTRTEEILAQLVGFKTISTDSNLLLIDFAEDLLNRCGFQVRRLPDATGAKAGLFARTGPDGAGVLLSGHTDVVPTEGQLWTRDPFTLTREEDRLYGRGTTDMKGFIASALAMAERAALTPLQRPLMLALSYDEEIGCVGIRQMIGDLQSSIGLPAFCIVGEPTEMQVAVGHKGKGALRATCRGQSGHSALAPHFVNAIHLATDFTAALRDLQSHFARAGHRDPAYDVPYSTIHVGKITGGRALNIVADEAVVEFEYRHLPTDDPDDIMARIQDAAQRVARPYQGRCAQATITVERTNAYPGLDVDEQEQVVTFVKTLARTNHIIKVAFGAESGFFDGIGIPTVVCGPGSMSDQGHMPDEYVTRTQLASCDAMLDRLLTHLQSPT